MSFLDKKLSGMLHLAQREANVRQSMDTQLKEQAIALYHANVAIANSLKMAERRKEELEFLNVLAHQIVSDSTYEEVLVKLLDLFASTFKATFALVLLTHERKIISNPTHTWCQSQQANDCIQEGKEAIAFLSTVVIQQDNEWQLKPYLSSDGNRQVGRLFIHLSDNHVRGHLVCFDLARTELNMDFLTILNTARDLVISGLKRRLFEVKVVKRNQLLQDSMADLERLQAKLIHSEKMASLGQLAAGVAHEINNPVGFISANSDILKEYVSDLEQCVKKLRDVCLDRSSSSEAFTRIYQQYELDYILSDMHDILAANHDGLGRIKDIVSGLSTFSHPGELKKGPVCLADCIKISLQLVANQLKYLHVVENTLPEVLPAIHGNVGQLQQVFVILMVNAMHAMPEGGTLTFAHALDETSLTLIISDTGCGIAPEHLSQIFTPFFTTKPVGSGTGLGLSITHSILEAHNATISVKSELGSGTEFHLRFKLL